MQCQDHDCCQDEAAPCVPPEDMLGGVTPEDERKCTRHLLRGQFGKKVFHKLILRAATLEAALVKASMPSKGATTSIKHFQHEFVNSAIQTYTKILLAGGEPSSASLIRLPPPPQFQVWEPDQNGFPRRWHKPWVQSPAQPSTPPQVNYHDDEPILKMASSAEHPTDTSKQTCLGATLLGYF